MDFEVDLEAQPAALVVTQGAASFKLKHHYLTATERVQAVELMSLDVPAAFMLLMSKVYDWEGVKKKAGGDQPFVHKNSDGSVKERYLDAVMGRVDYAEHIRTMFRQLAINGVKLERTGQILTSYMSGAEAAALVQELDDFLARRGGTRTPPSTD